MAEPIYQITTEVSEEDFGRVLKVSCPQKWIVEFLLIALMDILFAINFCFDSSPEMLSTCSGFLLVIQWFISRCSDAKVKTIA